MPDPITQDNFPAEWAKTPEVQLFGKEFHALCTELRRVRKIQDSKGQPIMLDIQAQLIWANEQSGDRVVVVLKCTNSRGVNLCTAVYGRIQEIHHLMDLGTRRILDLTVDSIVF